jgi:hypothetical protein
MKTFIVEMEEESIKGGKVRFRAVDIRALQEARAVPEITDTCVDMENLLKQVRNGVKFYSVNTAND